MDLEASSPSVQLRKTQRVLACKQCQQRKIKCDRKFPCLTCVKSGVQCVPAALNQRQRKRRFPEKDLLDRLRKYERLLRKHNIAFEPLHGEVSKAQTGTDVRGNDGQDSAEGPFVGQKQTSSPTSDRNENDYEAKNIWHAMTQGFRESDNNSDSSLDEVRETTVKTAWDQTRDDDQLLFASRTRAIDLFTLHPTPVHIFRLWQIYLDNVDPLLKVTHTPSLQGQIIEAVGDLKNIKPVLEALLFSIYCMSVLSLSNTECQTLFSSSKDDLLKEYQVGCQQALVNCSFLRTNDRDCLTALFLYLVSIKPNTVAQSLTSLLGIAIRIAQRIGIHSESALSKCSVFEAEMRRRLWWSLTLFDARACEIGSVKSVTLDPTWDCRIPFSANDSVLRPDMKSQPAAQGVLTDALFAIVRSELGDQIRHCMFHLDLTCPALKPITKHFREGVTTDDSDLTKIETAIEERYLSKCDPENSVHYLTIWVTRASLAKCRLMEHHLKHAEAAGSRMEAQHQAATSLALRMLECDTKIMVSPLTKKYLWYNQSYFPFPAWLQLVQHLKKRPTGGQAQHAWEVMNENFMAWLDSQFNTENPFFQFLAKIILGAWNICDSACKQEGSPLARPNFVSAIQNIILKKRTETSSDTELDEMNAAMDVAFDGTSMPKSMGPFDQNSLYIPEMQMMIPDAYSSFRSQFPFNHYLSHMSWNSSNFSNQFGFSAFSDMGTL